MTNNYSNGSISTSGSLQSIERTATIAWCPTPNASGQPLLASGTVAGALDSSFSSSCQLEVYELSLDGHKAQRSLVSLPAPTRFHKLGWSGHKEGCIVGAMEDGSVGFWNAGRILGGAPNTPAIIKKDVHSGPVRGLAVNPTNSFLVATGSADAEVFIWDLNEFKSMLPGSGKSARLTQVTDLAWNRQHPFILASSSANGCTTIWDLRHRREIVQLAGKSSVSAICWSPDEATSIVTASDDNSTPVISLWDLRNANAPDKQLSGGHEKGILSLAWCPQDSDLLLSSGKDNRIVYWNPKTCTQLGYAEPSSNWIYDLSWWPRNPDLFAAASFDGHVNIYSFQTLSSAPNRTGNASNELFGNSTASTSQPDTSFKQIPKWLKRPMSASFGFGGKLFTVSGRKTAVITGAGELGLDTAISSQRLSEYCTERATKDPKAAHFWASMAAVTVSDGDYRKSLLKMFGITLEDHSAQVQNDNNSAAVSSPSTYPTAYGEIEQLSASMAATSPFDFPPPTAAGDSFDSFASDAAITEEKPLRRRSTFCGESFHLYPKEVTQEERDITRAIIAGRYTEAVDICIRTDRLSDALLVAVCGGPQLVAKTQRLYFQKVKCPYLRVVSGIVKKDLVDVVDNVDLADWKDVLALICAKAEASEFEYLCSLLADRLATGENGDEQGAVLGYVLGGHALKAAALLLKSAKRTMNEVQGSAVLYTAWLESLVDRIRTAHHVASHHSQRPCTLGELVQQVPELYRYFLLYSFVLEERGCAGNAAEILGMIGLRTGEGPSAAGTGNAFQEALKAFGYRLGQLTGVQQLAQSPPFELVDVQNESISFNNQQQQQQPPGQYYQPPAQPTYQAPAQPAYQPAQPSYPAYPQQPANNAYGYSSPTYAASQQPSQYAIPQQPSQYATHQASQYAPQQQQSQYTTPQQQPSQYTTPQQPSQYAATSSQYAPPQPSYTPPQQPSQYYPTQQPLQQQQQQAPAYAPPSFEVPKPSIPVPIAISPSPSAPMMNNPALPNTAPINAPGVNTGAFNDAPIVQPKIQKQPAPIVSPVRPTIPSATPTTTTAPLPNSSYLPQPPQAPAATPNSPIGNLATFNFVVDASKIVPNLMPIYQSFNVLIGFCLQKSTPAQKRVVEDSIKRLQSLIAQLYRQELSAPVVSILQQVAQQLHARQYDAAAAGCQQLMTNNFNEVGTWIVAARRLIDMAKTLPTN